MLTECVINLSEGRDLSVVHRIAATAGSTLLDIHADPEHNRSVLTLAGPADVVEEAARSVVTCAVRCIDLRSHQGVHPRLGAADVVPFVPLASTGPPASSSLSATGRPDPGSLDGAIAARDRFARWAGDELDLPCFLYGPERSLPDIRRTAFLSLDPDTGPRTPHPTAGAAAVGARHILIAYNVWVTTPSGHDQANGHASAVDLARRVANHVRGPAVRALGLAVEGGAQVSCNLIDRHLVSVATLYDAVAHEVETNGGAVVRAELVGLAPYDVVRGVPRHRWTELDLSEDRTIEARLASVGSRQVRPGDAD